MIPEPLEETKQLRVLSFRRPTEAQRGRRRGLQAPPSNSANGLGIMSPATNEQNTRRGTTKRLERAENDQQAGRR